MTVARDKASRHIQSIVSLASCLPEIYDTRQHLLQPLPTVEPRRRYPIVHPPIPGHPGQCISPPDYGRHHSRHVQPRPIASPRLTFFLASQLFLVELHRPLTRLVTFSGVPCNERELSVVAVLRLQRKVVNTGSIVDSDRHGWPINQSVPLSSQVLYCICPPLRPHR